jgi:hypothetical protein
VESITAQALEQFFRRLGEEISAPTKFFLDGGSALCLLGSPRETLDIDYFIDGETVEVEQSLKELSTELKLDLESVPIKEFIPLPPGAEARKRFVGKFGKVEVYIFDLYSIALSKIARGFESDLEDVEFMLKQNLISWEELETDYQRILPEAHTVDIDPKEFNIYFATLKQRIQG